MAPLAVDLAPHDPRLGTVSWIRKDGGPAVFDQPRKAMLVQLDDSAVQPDVFLDGGLMRSAAEAGERWVFVERLAQQGVRQACIEVRCQFAWEEPAALCCLDKRTAESLAAIGPRNNILGP
jgi:hypothetical protein